MLQLKFLFFGFALLYAELIEAYDITAHNLTSQWQLAFNSKYGFNVVQSRDRLFYVYFPVGPEVKIRLETANLTNDACEILLESNSTLVDRFDKVSSLGNGKIVVFADIRNIVGVSSNRTFYVIDPDKCSYVKGASYKVKETRDRWHVVTYQNTFDIFATNTSNCPIHRICRNTYVDSGELIDSSIINLVGPLGYPIWTIQSVLKNDPSDGYFFGSMYYNPSRFFVIRRLNSKLEVLQERRINATVEYTVDNGCMILHYSFGRDSELRTMILDSRLIPLADISPRYPEHCLSLAYGYFTNDSILEVFSCRKYKENGIDFSSYIRLISINGKASKIVKFHDNSNHTFRIFKLKDNLYCIVAVFHEETEFAFTDEFYFITRCIH